MPRFLTTPRFLTAPRLQEKPGLMLLNKALFYVSSMGLLILFKLKIENLLTAFNNALAGKAQMKAKDHSSYRKSLPNNC